jgi:hypothetical protein
LIFGGSSGSEKNNIASGTDWHRDWTDDDVAERLGLPLICVDARHAKAVLTTQINKCDRNDAAGIARIMQTGWFKEVRVKDLDSQGSRDTAGKVVPAGTVAVVKSSDSMRVPESQPRLTPSRGGHARREQWARQDDGGELDTQTRN